MAAQAEHHAAMDIADRAMLARASGDVDAWRRETLAALERERRAAELVDPTGLEPSRSVPWRSAASLALDAGLIDEARELIERVCGASRRRTSRRSCGSCSRSATGARRREAVRSPIEVDPPRR